MKGGTAGIIGLGSLVAALVIVLFVTGSWVAPVTVGLIIFGFIMLARSNLD